MTPSETSLQVNKRARSPSEVSGKENDAPEAYNSGGKKRRVETDTIHPSKTASSSNPAPEGPDPYTTFPAPTKDFIQLRFQLQRFKGVYRTVQVPITYTFANLHTLLQYLFGWSGRRSHRTRVYTNVEIYTSPAAKQVGCIKKKGQAPEFPAEWVEDHAHLSEELQEVARTWFEIENRDAAIYEVVAVGKNKGGRGKFGDYSWHYKVEDPELALSDIWNIDEEKNLSGGEMGNESIGLIYDYEIHSSWSVDITVDGGFYHSETPSNDIQVMAAKGAPSVEEKHDWSPSHPDGCKKSVSNLLFSSRNFKAYCKKKISSRVKREELSVYVLKTGGMTDEQVKARQAKLDIEGAATRKAIDKIEKERQKQIRAEKKREREERAALREYESDSDY